MCLYRRERIDIAYLYIYKYTHKLEKRETTEEIERVIHI